MNVQIIPVITLTGNKLMRTFLLMLAETSSVYKNIAMIRDLVVSGEPPRQYLHARLNSKRMGHDVYIPPNLNKPENRLELITRATNIVRTACPLGKVGCEAAVDLMYPMEHIVDPTIFCYKTTCPFEDGGGSGDREPLNNPRPSDSALQTVQLG